MGGSGLRGSGPHDVFERRLVQAGERIFSQGDVGHVMYYLHSGMVRIWQGNEADREADQKVIGIITDGGIFGEMALVDGAPRMAHATAEEESLIYLIPASVLQAKLDHADPFLRGLIRILVSNLRASALG